MTKAVDVRVTGRVQGVFYRARCADQARRLGVTGWVRNDGDGAVTARFEGPAAAVDRLVAWCREGSSRSRVDEITVGAAEVEGLSGFETR